MKVVADALGNIADVLESFADVLDNIADTVESFADVVDYFADSVGNNLHQQENKVSSVSFPIFACIYN